MSAALVAEVSRVLGAPVADARPVAGGDINQAMAMTLADGSRLFVKHRPGADAQMYRAEAAGLAWLADADALPVPAVAAVGEGTPAFLALEWIERAPPAPYHDEALGRGLARLHRAGAPSFGLACDNYIGNIPQRNASAPSWAAFYGQRRLLDMARRAAADARLDPGDLSALERLVARLGELCGPDEPPARLHGDLWGGNAMCDASGAPVLVDPAVYGGHREVDLAMMRLFGGFSNRVFAAYAEEYPLADGHEDRVELYQLYPLLVHVVLFGGGYARSARRIIARFGGA